MMEQRWEGYGHTPRMARAPGGWKREGGRTLPWGLQREWGPRGHLESGRLPSRPVRQYISVMLSHTVRGTLSQPRQERNAGSGDV